eukprot:366573-Chlamydomonas_euryale.AAC.16
MPDTGLSKLHHPNLNTSRQQTILQSKRRCRTANTFSEPCTSRNTSPTWPRQAVELLDELERLVSFSELPGGPKAGDMVASASLERLSFAPFAAELLTAYAASPPAGCSHGRCGPGARHPVFLLACLPWVRSHCVSDSDSPACQPASPHASLPPCTPICGVLESHAFACACILAHGVALPP